MLELSVLGRSAVIDQIDGSITHLRGQKSGQAPAELVSWDSMLMLAGFWRESERLLRAPEQGLIYLSTRRH